MDNIDNLLKSFGLSTTEIHIYRTGLAYSSIDVAELSKQTHIKRPTVYHALQTLSEKGFISKKGTGSKLVFCMVSPDKVKKLIDQKIQQLEERKNSLDELAIFFAKNTLKEADKTKVEHYEGIDGMKLVIEEALYCRSRHWDIMAPKKNFFSEFDKEYATYFMETRKKRKIQARSLWDKEWTKTLSAEELSQRQPRSLPATLTKKFRSVIILFDDKLAIISSYASLSAILIQSKEVHDTVEALFEGLWTVSEEYKIK